MGEAGTHIQNLSMIQPDNLADRLNRLKKQIHIPSLERSPQCQASKFGKR